jgi:hypothetical protein
LDELETRMREVLLRLAMTSNGRTAAYDSSGGGTPDYVLVDDQGRGKLDPADAPHLTFAARWDRAVDDDERAAILKEAQEELDAIRRSHADPKAVESKDERDRRIIKDGRGFPASEVAIAIRCGVTDVHRARAAAGVDLEFGEKRVNGRALGRGDRNAEILHLAKNGMNPFQIATRLGIPRSSVRYVLDQARREK